MLFLVAIFPGIVLLWAEESVRISKLHRHADYCQTIVDRLAMVALLELVHLSKFVRNIQEPRREKTCIGVSDQKHQFIAYTSKETKTRPSASKRVVS